MSLGYGTKRGDTIIEVMFAFAIFSLVAIITVTMMNLGVAASERSLEMTVVRNEMNAQAEALRFVHSSYVAELTLPTCSIDATHETKCQRYRELWERIISNAVAPTSIGGYSIEMPFTNCRKIYENENALLKSNNAFILNTRQILPPGDDYSNDDAYISVNNSSQADLFAEATLNARVIYSKATGENGSDGSGNNSTGVLGNNKDPLEQFTRVAQVEGIWVVAVKDSSSGNPRYFDFYIGSCWNGSGSPSPTSLDTVVRLYNPEKNN